ncbi:hypothetical protein [Novosphingobium lentum]|uniref:hypothetical protein n=1 Tax=Novosphingobium lentum TaxID=145287 RepID=UPI0008309B9D|nr:hypothetical protein [Novosphingobium lentum]
MNSRAILSGAAVVAAAMPILAPVAAQATDPVQLASDVFVERFQPGPNGRVSRILERPQGLHPGDQLVFVVNWKASRARPFTVTNPLPRAVSFQRSVDGAEEVSVDGGRSWGRLEDLRVTDRDGGLRHANPEDVTHLRWRVPDRLAAIGAGQITYRGVVR